MNRHEHEYTTKVMTHLFSEESQLRAKLHVEAALANAQAALGIIPKKDAAVIQKAVKKVKLERVHAIDSKIHHETMAIAKALSEAAGPAGKYVHLGATSYDIVDTAWALLFKEAFIEIDSQLEELKTVLLSLAKKHKKTIMVGRTHGQHALPITFGLKVAVWAAEVQRHLDRLEELRPRILVGKMSGAVGTGAAFGPKAMRCQESVLRSLGLGVPLATTQILQRDRHAEAVLFLSLASQTLGKIALELRNLQRTEIGEVQEYYDKKNQVGSSTMPQKQNPWRSERIGGLARYMQGLAVPVLSNVQLEHERDLTNSSFERVAIPQSFKITSFALEELITILTNIQVNEERMRYNLDETQGRNMAEAVMIALTAKGMAREEAHELVRKASVKSAEQGIALQLSLEDDSKIMKKLSPTEIASALNPEKYVGSSTAQVVALVKKLSR